MTEEKNIQNTQTPPKATQPQEVLQQGSSSAQRFHYSGFWVRGAARIIDGLIIGPIVAIIVLPVGFVVGMVSSMNDSVFINIVGQVIFAIIGLMVGWGYYIFMTYKFQATLGKMAVGAKVINENGQKLSLGSVILRETVGKFVSGLILSIGYLMAAFTSKKQALHDMIAHSAVIYKDAQKGANRTVVSIVYVLYGLLLMMLFAIIFFVIFIVGLAGFQATHSGNTSNSVFNSIKNEVEHDDNFLKDLDDDINNISNDKQNYDMMNYDDEVNY